jgi:hypothetical protein
MALMGEAGFGGDLPDAQATVPKQSGGAVDPPLDNVLMHRHSARLAPWLLMRQFFANPSISAEFERR